MKAKRLKVIRLTCVVCGAALELDDEGEVTGYVETKPHETGAPEPEAPNSDDALKPGAGAPDPEIEPSSPEEPSSGGFLTW